VTRLEAPRGRGRWGAGDLGQGEPRAMLGLGQRGRATSRLAGVRPVFVLLGLFWKLQNSKFLYRSRQSDEYQSCSSNYP
jgi:hypothetical protein